MAQSAQGLDVSNFQGLYSWSAVSGLSFGIHRLTQGLAADHANSPDPTAQWNHTEIGKKGLIRGAYHFLDPAESGAAQAQYFVAQYAKLGYGQRDMFWLDNEDAHGQPPGTVAMCAQAFMRELDKLVPHNPRGVYTFINFAKEGNCSGLGSWPLWLAYPNATAPAPPPPWVNWKFWQWGIRNGVDADAFNGTSAKLADWIASYAPAPDPVPAAGPERHVADGNASLRTFAHSRGRTVQQALWESALHAPSGYGPAQRGYIAAGAWDALMPQGMIVWLP
jgi:lysozyme